LDAAIRGLVKEHHLPGIAVGVVEGGELVFAEGFGLADIESGRQQDPSLKQRIGSITKTMVGLCAMALVEEGRLSLADRVAERLPEVTFHGPAEGLTVRHLMTHTGGIGEAPMPEQIRDPFAALWSDSPDVPGVPEAYPEGITIEVEPGRKWAYANHGFVLLGEIVARAEGAPIEEVLRRRVFEPLGMEHTDCLDQPNADLTTGYHRELGPDERELRERAGWEIEDEEAVDGHNIRGRYRYVMGRAAGAVQSTIPDMARYASALLRKGGGIVSAETFEEMVAPHWCPDDRLMSLGLALFREPRYGRRTFRHGGDVDGGWNTMLTVSPADDMAVLVHMNLSYNRFDLVESRIVQAAMGAPDEVAVGGELDGWALVSAPGVYEPLPGRLTNFRIMTQTGLIQITREGDELALRSRWGAWKDGFRMRPADRDDPAFFALETGEPEPPRVALLRDADGMVTGLRCDRLVEMVRNDSLEPWV
jgi:CubicO group peptidase (beta-lactamase class C family)